MTDSDPLAKFDPDGDLESMTLDPPGSIAVVGAGPLGIEAALYGRFLGYEVTLFERSSIGSSIADRRNDPLPLPSSRCWSPLAAAALEAQFPERFPGKGPETVGEWLEIGLIPLAETDLLRGRLRMPAEVTRIETLEMTDQQAVESEQDDEESWEPVPPDFELTIRDVSGGESKAEFEVVILAIGSASPPLLGFDLPAPYLFRIGGESESQAEQSLTRGLRQIVALFATLAGRDALDLYRPRRQ